MARASQYDAGELRNKSIAVGAPARYSVAMGAVASNEQPRSDITAEPGLLGKSGVLEFQQQFGAAGVAVSANVAQALNSFELRGHLPGAQCYRLSNGGYFLAPTRQVRVYLGGTDSGCVELTAEAAGMAASIIALNLHRNSSAECLQHYVCLRDYARSHQESAGIQAVLNAYL